MEIPRDLYPFEGRTVQVGGHGIHTLDEGRGSPVLMVHGNPTWSFYYRNLVLALRDTHRVVVPDHIGCGFSDKPSLDEYPYTLDRRVEDLTALVDSLELGDDITLVVHDWGGMIGMAWAVRNAHRIRRIVVLNTAAFPKPDSKRLPWSLGLVRNTWLGAWLVQGFNAFSWGATRLAVTRRPLSPPVRKAYCAPHDTWDNRLSTLRFVQDIPLGPEDPGWDTVTRTADGLKAFADTPVLICWGARDFVFDDHFLREWQSRWPHATVHRYEDCGHYVLEDARDEVIAQVRTF
ncbi:MAG: alpha/beta fold hydrolase, partial [Myxococcota bacterium]|nr:alpha/beta fold hydrolase [Myxococcota bacterium]